MKLSKGWGGSLSRKGSRIKWFQSSHCIPPDAQRFWATSKTGPVGEIVMTFGGPKNPSCLRRVQMWGLQFVAGAARGRGIHGTRASRGSNGGGDMWWTRILGVTFWKMHQVTMAFCFFFHRWQISFEGFGFKVTKWLCVFSSCWAQGTLFLLVIPMPAPETREADPVAVDVAETDAKPLTKDVTGPWNSNPGIHWLSRQLIDLWNSTYTALKWPMLQFHFF